MQIPHEMKIALIPVVLAGLLLSGACVSAPPSTTLSPVPSPVSTVTTAAGNVSTVQTLVTPPCCKPTVTGTAPAGTYSAANNTAEQAPPPAQIICHCPMEPAGSVPAAVTPTPDDGRCHCPGTG